MARCGQCGAELPDYYTSCPNCGGTQVVRGDGTAPQAQPNAYMPAPAQREVTSTAGWVGWLLLCSYVPLIGVIIMLLTAKDPSAKNYAKLMVVFMIIGAIIGAIISAVMVPAMVGYMEKANAVHTVYGMISALIH